MPDPGHREPPRASVSVCIPHHGNAPEFLRLAVTSALHALPSGAELVVLADGPGAAKSAAVAALPPGVRVIASSEPVGLVENWNRCLAAARGDLVHVLHDDDAVTPDFYRAVLGLRDRFPGAALYATGFRYFEGPLGDAPSPAAAAPRLIAGDEAAEFLLRQGQHVCASVVLARRVIDEAGPFDPRFPYCPDEEAYLRYAQRGGVAFDSRPLYRERIHSGQERLRTWRRPDFVGTYVRARVTGAAGFGETAVRLAEEITAANVIRIGARLAGEGQPGEGRARLAELERVLPQAARGRPFRAARWACDSRAGRVAVRIAFGAAWVILRARVRRQARRG